MQIRFGRAAFALPLALAFATSAAAVPLNYAVDPFESDLATAFSLNNTVDVTPDPLNEFPQGGNLIGEVQTKPSFASKAVIDTGLPGNFDDGANGITFSELSIVYNEVAQLFSGGSIFVPLGGGDTQPLLLTASVADLKIVLDAPFSSSLTPGVNPNEFLWAGVASMTISGNLAPSIVVPTLQTVEPDPVPFSQSVSLALAGTFSGDDMGTQVTVGIPSGALQNQDLSLDPIMETLDPLGLGLVTIDVNLANLLITDNSSSIVYKNVQPIPEPGTALLLGLGLTALATAGRRR